MRRLAPYQTGLWLAEYINIRCQLCTVYRSIPQSQLLQSHSSPNPSLSSPHSFFANTRKQFNQRFSSGLLCARCHNSIAWLPTPFAVDIAVDIAAGMMLNIQAATYYDYPIRQAIKTAKEDSTRH